MQVDRNPFDPSYGKVEYPIIDNNNGSSDQGSISVEVEMIDPPNPGYSYEKLIDNPIFRTILIFSSVNR